MTQARAAGGAAEADRRGTTFDAPDSSLALHFDDLAQWGGVDELPEVRRAIEQRSAARQALTDLTARLAEAREAVREAVDVATHRAARAEEARLADALAEAKLVLPVVERSLPAARDAAFEAVAAIVQDEYRQRLPALHVALDDFDKAVQQIAEVEAVASRFTLAANSSYAPGRRALGDVDIASSIRDRIEQWRAWLSVRGADGA